MGMNGIYLISIIIMGVSWLVSNTLKRRFKEYSELPLNLTGKEIAERMLHENGINDVQVISVPGQLTDHYNPADKTVNLSDWVYAQANVAAAAVAAAGCGDTERPCRRAERADDTGTARRIVGAGHAACRSSAGECSCAAAPEQRRVRCQPSD